MEKLDVNQIIHDHYVVPGLWASAIIMVIGLMGLAYEYGRERGRKEAERRG